MPEAIQADSIGLVIPQSMTFQEPLLLDCAAMLPACTPVDDTCDQLNASRPDAIHVIHARYSHRHAAGCHYLDDRKPGRRDTCAGPGNPWGKDSAGIVVRDLARLAPRTA